MNYALMKDCKVMVKTPTGAAWRTIFKPFSEQPFLWQTREGATMAAEMQGAAVIPVNQLARRKM